MCIDVVVIMPHILVGSMTNNSRIKLNAAFINFDGQ